MVYNAEQTCVRGQPFAQARSNLYQSLYEKDILEILAQSLDYDEQIQINGYCKIALCNKYTNTNMIISQSLVFSSTLEVHIRNLTSFFHIIRHVVISAIHY